jgi:ankyrin repeat protein
MWAINNGHENLVGLLLTRKLNIESSDSLKRTALHHSACIGQINSMKLLIQCRAALETRDSLGRTPLLSAINRGQAAAVEYLLEAGADPAAFDEQRKGALHLSIESDLSIQLVALLVAYGAPVDILDIDNMSPLDGTVQYNRRGIASLLFNNGVSLDFGIQRRYWMPNLLDGNVVYELNNINKGPRVSNAGYRWLDRTAFCGVGNAEMMEFLLSQGADPNRLSQYQEAPLHLAFPRRVQGPDYRDAWNKDCWRIECLWDFVGFDGEDEAEAVVTRICRSAKVCCRGPPQR